MGEVTEQGGDSDLDIQMLSVVLCIMGSSEAENVLALTGVGRQEGEEKRVCSPRGRLKVLYSPRDQNM